MKLLTEANIFRGLFCIYVLLIHCIGTPSRELESLSFLSTVINVMSKGAVQAFKFVSGLTISHRYRSKELNTLSFYKKRIKNTLIPYIVFSIFYYIVYQFINNYDFSISYLINRILTSNAAYNLYFIIIIMQFYISDYMEIIQKYKNNILFIIRVL